jgi:hypothetical protein
MLNAIKIASLLRSNRPQMRLDALVTSGFCSPDDLDLKIKDRMRMLSEKDALDSIDEINSCSRGDIRNFARSVVSVCYCFEHPCWCFHF